MLLVKRITEEEPPKLDEGYSKELNGLVHSLLSKRPADRPAIREVLDGGFVKKYGSKFYSPKKMEENDVG